MGVEERLRRDNGEDRGRELGREGERVREREREGERGRERGREGERERGGEREGERERVSEGERQSLLNSPGAVDSSTSPVIIKPYVFRMCEIEGFRYRVSVSMNAHMIVCVCAGNVLCVGKCVCLCVCACVCVCVCVCVCENITSFPKGCTESYHQGIQ